VEGDLLVFAPKASMTVGKDTLDVPSVSFKHLAKQREGMQGVAETAPLIVYVVGKKHLELPASDGGRVTNLACRASRGVCGDRESLFPPGVLTINSLTQYALGLEFRGLRLYKHR